jgi:hypothetical protein
MAVDLPDLIEDMSPDPWEAGLQIVQELHYIISTALDERLILGQPPIRGRDIDTDPHRHLSPR